MSGHLYEDVYRELHASGQAGWGGDRHARRIESWRRTLDLAIRSDWFPKRGQPLLELGSGAGDVGIELARRGFEVTGVEISSTAVAMARRRVMRENLFARFVIGDVRDLSVYADGAFAGVIDSNCLHCICGEDRAVAISQIHRVLRPKGFLLVSSMVGDPKEATVLADFNSQSRCQIRAGAPYRFMPLPESLVREFEDAGFIVLRHELRENPWWDHLELWLIKAVMR